MDHNGVMNSQQQQQHVLINPNGTSNGQRSVMVQRGTSASASSRSAYQIQASTVSQLSQQQQSHQYQQQHPQMYQKRVSPDMASAHAYTSSSLPTQNGNYQGMTGSSVHSSLGLENGSQAGLQQYQQQATHIQGQVQQNQHYQPSPLPQQHTSAHYSTSLQLQQQQQQMLQQQQQQQQIQQTPHQLQQDSYRQQHQQNLQIKQQLQQRSIQQQQRYQKQQQQQPKQILQHPKSAAASQVQTPLTSNLQSQTTQSSSPLGVDSTGATGEKLTEEKEEKENTKEEDSKENASSASEKPSLANTKEKTPMCLINELARFNKMSHQYTLVDEQGPAHKKTFFVKLKLGEEEYSASGESIKKAQHAAADIALTETKYKHPPPKPARYLLGNVDAEEGNITPTVELNALAMKRGEAAVYKAIEPQQPPYYHQPNMDFRGLYNQRYHQYSRGGRDPRYRGNGVLWPLRYHYPRMNRAFYVSLRVGHREFIGDGPTRQAARHNAAQKALRILKNLPVSNNENKNKAQEQVPEEDEVDDSLKSEISLVHEIALRRNMPVNFEVIREAGPPHMKNFITRCTVADIVTEAEGNSKKLSKKRAAELMLEELKKLRPLPAPTYARPKAKVQLNKKKNRNIIKSEIQQQKADPNYGVGINPISRLIQIMQAQKKREPVYTLVAERGLPRRREFIMQVEVEDRTCTGTGPNKKLAKRSAAEAMLQELGYTKPSPQPTKSSIKHHSSGENAVSNGDKKVTFVENDTQPAESEKATISSSQPTQQRVPGLLHLPSNKPLGPTSPAPSSSCNHAPKEPQVNLANILKPNLRPEIQLKELCKAMGYVVEIDDFTKKRTTGTEHMCRIAVGSEPSQNFHGSGNTLESSRDMAALDALKVLLTRAKDIHPGGDGPQVKKDLLTRSSLPLKKDISK